MASVGGGGGPNKPSGAPPEGVGRADLGSKEGIKEFKKAAGQEVPQTVVDSFQRAGAKIEAKLQNISGTALAQKLNFTNADLALLARTFAVVLQQQPNADRLTRSKLFAKAILQKKGLSRRGKLSNLLDDENEAYEEKDRKALEEMFELLAEQLDSTPVFAQLVEEVTESARKIR